jgi:hypothetical protein
VIVMVAAFASILFSTNSAIAFKGLLCESAMMRIAFQSSPILSLPRSAALLFRGTFGLDPCEGLLPGVGGLRWILFAHDGDFFLRGCDGRVRGGCHSLSAMTDPGSEAWLTYRVSAVTNNPLCRSASA